MLLVNTGRQRKRGVSGVNLFWSLAPLKQQVMIYHGWGSHSFIGAEAPALLLPLLNCLADILVVIDLNALILFDHVFTYLLTVNLDYLSCKPARHMVRALRMEA